MNDYSSVRSAADSLRNAAYAKVRAVLALPSVSIHP